MTTLVRLFAPMLLLALADAPAFAQEDMTAEELAKYQNDVLQALVEIQNPLTPFDYITFSVSHPVVVLEGFATSPDVKRNAAAAVRKVPWVTHVVNQIQYIPAEPTINELRRETLSILKTAVPQAFPQSRAYIRIKIDEMKVTLVGGVDPGDVKRLEAAVVQVNQLPLVQGVDNQVVVRPNPR